MRRDLLGYRSTPLNQSALEQASGCRRLEVIHKESELFMQLYFL